jgi:SAM-dependent methyltransferase
LADGYARFRPTYPPSAIDYVVERCKLGPTSLLVDVGCGTGISSRLFAERGVRVIGIDPNEDMLAKARSSAFHPQAASPVYHLGSAEATGLEACIADGVLAAQAFHWFDAALALAEFHRILKPGGWVILIWNERDETDRFTAAYGDVLRNWPETAAVEGSRARGGEPLMASSWFVDCERRLFSNEQELDKEGLIGRALSASYAPRDPAQVTRFTELISDVFKRFEQKGRVAMRYETSVYSARRRELGKVP